jgi:hypothetical protein
MLSDLESAMALVEGQELEVVSSVKDWWHQAMEEASKILKWPERFVVQFNPAIWRGSRYVVGMRLLSDPWSDLLIFEFATPNYVFPFDCFSEAGAKKGVMLHELAHLADDNRWGFDLRGLRKEAGQYVTREQRAELLAFACSPIDVYQANLALVQSTAWTLGVDLGQHAKALAAVETAGHAGLPRKVDPIDVYRELQAEGIPVDRVLKAYLSTFVFSLAGLAAVPDDNLREDLGIKKSRDLTQANEWLCRHLRGELDYTELQELLEGVGYYGFSQKDYNPFSCLDLSCVDRKAAGENVNRARIYFGEESCFEDLRRAVEKLDARLKNL